MNQANIPLSAQGEMLAQLQAAAKEVTSYLHLAETESTNDVVRDMARRQVPEIAVVVADAQTRGRGRLGRRWISQPGTGLWVSPPGSSRNCPSHKWNSVPRGCVGDQGGHRQPLRAYQSAAEMAQRCGGRLRKN